MKKPSTLRHRLNALAAFGVCVAAVAGRLSAQAPGTDASGVRGLLALFDREIRETHVARVGWVRSLQVLAGPASPATRDSLLDGLEHFAAASDDRQVAYFAAAVIAEAGARAQARPLPGAVPRLERIYRATGDAYVRRGIRGRAYLLADRTAAARLLASIAAEPEADAARQAVLGDVDSPQLEALRELAAMGAAGREALMDLHRRDAIHGPAARDYLRQLAHRGFPVEDRPLPGAR